jgi:glycosyltransferase involved in cell wall biosynthesis
MLEAACRLSRERGFNFVFVGGTAISIRATTTAIPADVASHVNFVGDVNDPKELAQYYRRATCFMFPSLYESSGLPPIEAMACGCPVIVSDIPALRERCGGAAIYCDPEDIESVAAAVVRVVDDSRLQSTLSADGLARAAQFSWKRCARETLDLIISETRV